MNILADAWQSLKENYEVLLPFLGLAALINTLSRLAASGISAIEEPAWAAALLPLGRDLLLASAYSAVYAILLARLGRNIDRPLWKCADDLEALRRFFEPWFILGLSVLLLQRLLGRAYAAEVQDLALFLELAHMAVIIFLIPVGACVMRMGRLDWRHLGDTLAPMFRQFHLTILVLLLGFMQVMLFYVWAQLAVDSPAYLAPIPFDLLSAFLDLLAFAAMWRICMIDRDTPREDEDDFDF